METQKEKGSEQSTVLAEEQQTLESVAGGLSVHSGSALAPRQEYSPELHKQTLERIREVRRGSFIDEEQADVYWQNTEKAIAKAMEISPGTFTSGVYDFLGHFGINMYKRTARSAMKSLRAEATSVGEEVAKLELRLKGTVEYVSPAEGQPAEDFLEQRRFVRESDKGLRYKLSESVDDAIILAYQYRNGIKELQDYGARISAIESDIEKIKSSPQDESTPSKLAALQAKRFVLCRERESLEFRQREYAQELHDYERRIDRLQSKIALYECVIRKGNSRVRQLESGIGILDDYIRERDDLVSISDLLENLRQIDRQHAKVNATLMVYDRVVADQLSHLTQSVQRNNSGYNSRPLMKRVDSMGKDDQNSEQNDMARIFGKLGLTLDTAL